MMEENEVAKEVRGMEGTFDKKLSMFEQYDSLYGEEMFDEWCYYRNDFEEDIAERLFKNSVRLG